MTRRLFDILYVRIPIADKANPPAVSWPPEATDRHLAEAYRERWQELTTDSEKHSTDPAWQRAMNSLTERRYADPVVQLLARTLAMQEAAEQRWTIFFSLKGCTGKEPLSPTHHIKREGQE